MQAVQFQAKEASQRCVQPTGSASLRAQLTPALGGTAIEGVKKRRFVNQRTSAFVFVILLVTNGCGTPTSSVKPTQASGDQIACQPAPGEAVEIADAKLIIEYHFTAHDIGVHGLFDDHGWSELCVYDPTGVQVLAVKPQSQLKDLTMAGIFFESREPPEAELSFNELKAKFPEGQYRVRGKNWDGTWLTGFATFTHQVPLAPTVVFPALAEQEENAGDVVVPLEDLKIEWADVTATVDGESVTITGYEIIITKVEHEDPHGFSQPIHNVHVAPGVNSLSVPVEFLEPGTVYELEVLALEESGNQTITSGFFKTESPG
jgi:hypothetical protein